MGTAKLWKISHIWSQCGCSAAPGRRVGRPRRLSNTVSSFISCGRPACGTHYCLGPHPLSTSSYLPTPPPLLPHLCLVCTQTQRDAACNHRRTQFQGQFQGYLLSGVNKKRKKTQRAKRKKEVGVEKKWMVIKNGSKNIFFEINK